MEATTKKFKRSPKKKRLGQHTYLSNRIVELRDNLTKETRGHVVSKMKEKLKYLEDEYNKIGNAAAYISDLARE